MGRNVKRKTVNVNVGEETFIAVSIVFDERRVTDLNNLNPKDYF